MKIVINPKYTHLSDFIEALPKQDAPIGEIIRNERNILQKVSVDGVDLVVKQYKRPTWLNRVVYSFLRKSKARRSYEYAGRLEAMGIASAEPIAYIEVKKNWFFHTGYFVSLRLTDPLLNTIEQCDPQTQNKVLDDLADFTVEIHHKGVVHYDYNSSNIFFREEDGKYRFTLIDINRMRFRKPSKKECVKSLQRLSLSLPSLIRMVSRYCELRQWNVSFFSGALLMRQGGFDLKHKIKRETKLTIQNIKGLFLEKKRNCA